MMFSMVFSIYGALTAYLIGEGEALRAIFHVGNPLWYSLLFFVIAFFIVYKGVKTAGNVELFLILLLLAIVIGIGIYSYEVILFALMGMPAVPEMQEVLEQKRHMKKVIIIGSIIPIVLYVLFAFIVVGIIGLENFEILEPNQKIATVALSMYSSPIL